MKARKATAASLLALAWLATGPTVAFAEDVQPDEPLTLEAPSEDPTADLYTTQDLTEESPAASEDLADDSQVVDESAVPEEQQRGADVPMLTSAAADNAEEPSSSPVLPIAAGAIALAVAGAVIAKRRGNRSDE